MAAIAPPPVTYQPAIPQSVIDEGRLSLAQMEVVVYAGQAHSQFLPNGRRKAFFSGDGTGVGKGREIARIILDNWLQGRTKAAWVSKSINLLSSAQRDWTDVAGRAYKDAIIAHGQTKLNDTITRQSGILFTTYSLLGDGLELAPHGGPTTTGDELFTPRPGEKQTRLQQLVQWLGKDFDGVIVFDEAHEMRNNTAQEGKRGKKQPAMKALAGVELQRLFPKARIVYFSATGGIKVADFGYAEGLGLWGHGTPFADKTMFIGGIEAGGLAAMELMAQDLKSAGLYLSRSLSYDGVTYERLVHVLTEDQRAIYDELARAWQIVLQNLNAALRLTDAESNGQAKSAAYSAFWGSHLRFFNQVLTAMQMPTLIDRVREDLDRGDAVLIQLVNTNEAQQNRQIQMIEQEGGSLDDLDLTPRDTLIQYLDNAFPTQQYEDYTDENGNVRSRPVLDSSGKPVLNAEAVAMKNELIERVGALRPYEEGTERACRR